MLSDTKSEVKNSSMSSDDYMVSNIIKRGTVIEGVLVSITKEGIWVDISAKTEGIVPIAEMKTLQSLNGLKTGDKIWVYVLETENEDGRAVLSLDKAKSIIGWKEIEKGLTDGNILEVEVKAFNKGGLLVDYHSIQGFIPLSHVHGIRRFDDEERNSFLTNKIGQKIKIRVLELDRAKHRLIFSEKVAFQESQEKAKDQLLVELKEGDTRKGRITSVHDFGAFVNIGGIDGLLPASEVCWERGMKVEDLVQVDSEIEVYVLKIDKEAKKVLLSQKRLLPHPWSNAGGKYQVGQVVTGEVTRLKPFGAFVALDDSVEGLVHISELSEKRVNHPKEVVKQGDTINVKILSIDTERRRISLSLKQAQQEMV